MKLKKLLATVIISALLMPLGAVGGEVYKWVDEQGRTHYSNQRPSHVGKVEVLEVFDAASASSPALNPGEELARIKDLTRQLAEEREARERQRLEQRLEALEESYQELLTQRARSQGEEERVIRSYVTPSYYYPFYPVPYKKHPPHGRIKIPKDPGKTEPPIGPRPPFKRIPPPQPLGRAVMPRSQGTLRLQGTSLPASAPNQPAPANPGSEKKP